MNHLNTKKLTSKEDLDDDVETIDMRFKKMSVEQ